MVDPSQLLPSAFEKCGLFPLNPDKVISRLPSQVNSETIARHVDRNLLKALEVRRYGDGAAKKVPVFRGKKVPAGQSYTMLVSSSSDSDESDEEEEEEKDEQTNNKENVADEKQKGKKRQLRKEEEQTRQKKSKDAISSSDDEADEKHRGSKGKKREVKKKKELNSKKKSKPVRNLDFISSWEESEDLTDEEQVQVTSHKQNNKNRFIGSLVSNLETSEGETDVEHVGERSEVTQKRIEDTENANENQPCSSWNCGSLVVADYEGDALVAEIIKNQDHVPKDFLRLSYTTHRGKNENIFSWPDRKDLYITAREDIILENVKVVPLNSRGHFCLTKDDFKRVTELMMVVVYHILFPPFQ